MQTYLYAIIYDSIILLYMGLLRSLMLDIKENNDDFNREDFLKALGKHIKHLREQKGLSAAEFGRRAFMERSHVARLEGGRTNPTSTTLKTICNALDIELEDLFKGL
jgi:ribosome-binding protein aMBF1 (putative translation factor)